MFRQYRKILPNEFIVAFGDTSSGLNDYSATQFLSKTHRDIPLVYHRKVIANEMTNAIHPILEKIYDVTGIKPTIAYERNNGGVFEMDRLASMNRLGKYDVFKMPGHGIDYNRLPDGEPEAIRYGWDTNTATRPKMLADWKEARDKQLIKVYDRQTITEHFSFVLVQTTSTWKAQAERGAHDDLVMSCAGAYQLYQICELPKKPQDYKRIMQQFPKSPVTNKYGMY